MELKVKFLEWSAGFPAAMLHEETAAKIGAHTGERVLIKTRSGSTKEIYTVIDVVGDELVKKNKIAFSKELRHRFEIKSGKKVDVELAVSPKSLYLIQKKLKKKELSKEEITNIIYDVANNFLSESEITLFVSGMYRSGMNMKETIALIEAILSSGTRMVFNNKYVVDKHCIGGVAGNRTTPLVVSICAAAGLTCPKNSSRAITSAAGTADVMEVVCKVDFTMDEIQKIVKKANACLVWSGELGLAPADAKILKVEKEIKIDPDALFLASIMSKKLAGGAKYILIDIPYGKGAKVDKKRALRLKRKFEAVGKYFNKKLKVVLTDGKQPIGHGIGPTLELMDIIKILDPKQEGPRDLMEKAIFLAGEIFELTGKIKKGKGKEMARKMLESGKAFAKFKEIVRAQYGEIGILRFGEFKKDMFVKKPGIIHEINNKKMNSMAVVAGCPTDKSSGLYLYHHIGEKVQKGDKLVTIYSESKLRLREAIKFYKKNKPIVIK